MKLVFATSNENKLNEMRQILPPGFEVDGLGDIGFEEDLPETQETIEGNAIQKARTLHEIMHVDCFAEDTGLEIDVLYGTPGVRSARYAGSQRSSRDNMQKVLQNMSGKGDRSARFRTVIALFLNDELFTFEGVVEGVILQAPEGSGGFGYDPIFKPLGFDHSFGSLPPEVKNKISHRARATQKLIKFLRQQASADKTKIQDD
jgi:XTP/dITP diphosphohydrolase